MSILKEYRTYRSLMMLVAIMLASCHRMSNSIDEIKLKCGVTSEAVDLERFFYLKAIDSSGTNLKSIDLKIVEVDGTIITQDATTEGCIPVPKVNTKWVRVVTLKNESFYGEVSDKAKGIQSIQTRKVEIPGNLKPVCKQNEIITPKALADAMDSITDNFSGRSIKLAFDLIPGNRSLENIHISLIPGKMALSDKLLSVPDEQYLLDVSLELENKELVSLSEKQCYLRVDRKSPEVKISSGDDAISMNSGRTISLSATEAGKTYYRISETRSVRECSCDGKTTSDPQNECNWSEYVEPIVFTTSGAYVLEYCAIDTSGNAGKKYSTAVNIDNSAPTVSLKWRGDTRESQVPEFTSYPLSRYGAEFAAGDDGPNLKTECQVNIRNLKNQNMDYVPVCLSSVCLNQSLVNFQQCDKNIDFKISSSSSFSEPFVVTLKVRATDLAGNSTEKAISKINGKYLGSFYGSGKEIPGKISTEILGTHDNGIWIQSDANIYTLKNGAVEEHSPATPIKDSWFKWYTDGSHTIATRRSEAWIRRGVSWVSLNAGKHPKSSIDTVAIGVDRAVLGTASETLVVSLRSEPNVEPIPLPISVENALSFNTGFVILNRNGALCWLMEASNNCPILDTFKAESIYKTMDRIYALTPDHKLKELTVSNGLLAGKELALSGSVTSIFQPSKSKIFLQSESNKIYELKEGKAHLAATIQEGDKSSRIWISPLGQIWIAGKQGRVKTSDGSLDFDLGQLVLNDIEFDSLGRAWLRVTSPGRFTTHLALASKLGLIEYPEYADGHVFSTNDGVWVTSASGLYHRKFVDSILLNFDGAGSRSMALDNGEDLWFVGYNQSIRVNGFGIKNFNTDGLAPLRSIKKGNVSLVIGDNKKLGLIKDTQLRSLMHLQILEIAPSLKRNCGVKT